MARKPNNNLQSTTQKTNMNPTIYDGITYHCTYVFFFFFYNKRWLFIGVNFQLMVVRSTKQLWWKTLLKIERIDIQWFWHQFSILNNHDPKDKIELDTHRLMLSTSLMKSTIYFQPLSTISISIYTFKIIISFVIESSILLLCQ